MCWKVVHIFSYFGHIRKKYEAFEFFICHLRNSKYYQSQGSLDQQRPICRHIGPNYLPGVGLCSLSPDQSPWRLLLDRRRIWIAT